MAVRRVENMMEVALVFPHQLFLPNPAFAPGREVRLIEDPLFFGTDERWPATMHFQKLLLHRASMRQYALEVKNLGHVAKYTPCPSTPGRTEELLEKHLPRNVTALYWTDPVDDVLGRRVRRYAQKRNIPLHTLESPQFLTPAKDRKEGFPPGKRPFMARFYEQQRKRMGILLSTDGSPVGGKWSFDTENRKRLPTEVTPPRPFLATTAHNLGDLEIEIDTQFPHAVGGRGRLLYPITHDEATRWLDDFLDHRLHDFGEYEDAISTRHDIIFHSVLTPSLNIGLLTPAQILTRTLQHAQEHDTPLNSLEGFIRQIIGWREFMRIMYERSGRRMRTRNFWNFSRPMPKSFYEGTTGIPPVDVVIRRLLRTGYCHHIERLMILGNFMLLCRIHPDEVYRWFMEMFSDSYDWVMVPNVYGMSQFADGGEFTTKPYLSGSNYVLKISDHKRGDWCEVWDALFWTFIADYHEFFASQPRLSMMARTCEKLGPKLVAHRRKAETFLGNLK